jgi:hypothetical protein
MYVRENLVFVQYVETAVLMAVRLVTMATLAMVMGAITPVRSNQAGVVSALLAHVAQPVVMGFQLAQKNVMMVVYWLVMGVAHFVS